MAVTGRPKKEINQELFEKLCGIMCTEEEIADMFDCSVDTVNRFCKETYQCTFAEAYKKFSAAGKASLRRYQFKLAQKSASMAIFLGKNYLGQTDHVELQDDTALAKLDDILKSVRENAIQQETE